MIEWNNISELFDSLNNNVSYVILRNYERFPDSLLLDTHPDIDFLCNNCQLFNEFAGSESRGKSKYDNVHRRISVSGKSISIDVRSLGDGYYDKCWEKEMLDNRVFDSRGFYVLDETNYFYSLLYHALVHKKNISSDYIRRIDSMKNNLNIDLSTDILTCLENYMRMKGFCYSYPHNSTCFIVQHKDKSLIERNFNKKISRKIWHILHRIT